MSKYQINNVYNNTTRCRFEKRRNATLKTSTAFVDDAYPDLIFLIPKYIAKMWKASDGELIMRDAEECICASVYMKRESEEGVTWMMDLEVGAELTLKPRFVFRNTHGSRNKTKKNYDADDDSASNENKRQLRQPLEVLVRVDTIEESKGGRKADIILSQM